MGYKVEKITIYFLSFWYYNILVITQQQQKKYGSWLLISKPPKTEF